MTPEKKKPKTPLEMLEIFRETLTTGIPLYLTRKKITKEHLEIFHVDAHNHYSDGKYQKALELFAAMILYNHLDQRSWMGAAACYKILQCYEKALRCYSRAFELDRESPLPAFCSVNCHLALNQTENALDALEKVISLSANKPEYAQQKKEAEELKSKLNSRS